MFAFFLNLFLTNKIQTPTSPAMPKAAISNKNIASADSLPLDFKSSSENNNDPIPINHKKNSVMGTNISEPDRNFNMEFMVK